MKARRKRLRRFRRIESGATFDPEKPPKRFWGVEFWRQRMYTQVVADLYSGYRLAVSPIPGRHVIKFSPISHSRKNAVPFGFCCGGFTSTAGLRHRQRGSSPKTRATTATPRLIIPSKRDTVFIRVARKRLATLSQPKPFGFSGRCNSRDSRLSPLSNDASPHRLPFLSLVTTPVSTATRVWFIRGPPEQVKQKIL